jgi:hypothetical protein
MSVIFFPSSMRFFSRSSASYKNKTKMRLKKYKSQTPPKFRKIHTIKKQYLLLLLTIFKNFFVKLKVIKIN